MADETFSENLLRALVAEIHFLNCVTASREMFGCGYFSLGVQEKAVIDQAVLAAVGENYTAVTPEWLAGQQPNPVGFVTPGMTPKPGPSR